MAAPPTSVHDLPAGGGGRADRTRRLLDAALCALECIAEHDPRGVLLLGPGWRVEFASVAAGSLLVEFFGADPESGLPLELQRWLEHRSDRPHRRRRGGRELTVRRNGDVLLLEAVAQFVPVTARERDVLALLARGHTNQQIADRLGIAPSVGVDPARHRRYTLMRVSGARPVGSFGSVLDGRHGSSPATATPPIRWRHGGHDRP